MTNVCSICSHTNKLEIDRQIVQGIPHLRIAKSYNLTDTAVRNHAQKHLSRQMLKSVEIKERINSDMLLTEIETCLDKTKAILLKAEQDNKPSLQLQAIKEIRSTIEFLTRLAVDLSRLGIQEQELALMGTNNHQSVIIFPEINPSMSAEKASRLYNEFIKTFNLNPGKSVVLLPEEKNLDDEIQKQTPPTSKMTRTTKPSGASRVLEAAAEMPDQEEDQEPDILNWQPPVPAKNTGWPGARR